MPAQLERDLAAATSMATATRASDDSNAHRRDLDDVAVAVGRHEACIEHE